MLRTVENGKPPITQSFYLLFNNAPAKITIDSKFSGYKYIRVGSILMRAGVTEAIYSLKIPGLFSSDLLLTDASNPQLSFFQIITKDISGTHECNILNNDDQGINQLLKVGLHLTFYD